ncbi:MAG TPA: hypothetical protein VHY35_12555 [Stellaceae bacterium]|jgi:catechol 2,3-dioxygenase-like lactoylglutathione lyase family enzyme|nr:hypothetical protein [Stellaceae bacterium]
MVRVKANFYGCVMIHHLSIAARDPKQAADVLAELMGGRAVPFPPNPGSFFALQLDDHGSGVEVYPAGTALQPNGSVGGTFIKRPTEGRGYGATHCAISVATDAGKVEDIARRAGWEVFRCNRGPFHVIEVWVENETMIEILPPDYAAEYLSFTQKDKVLASMANAPASAARQAAARQG